MERDFGGTVSRDYGVVDSRQPVTFTPRPTSGGLQQTVSGVVAYQIPRAEVLRSEGYYTGSERVFEVPRAGECWPLGVLEPEEGDAITGEDGIPWSVWEVTLITWDTIYRVVCKKER